MKNTHCYEYDGELYYDAFLDPIEDDEFYYWNPVSQRICIGRRAAEVRQQPKALKKAPRRRRSVCGSADQAGGGLGGAP